MEWIWTGLMVMFMGVLLLGLLAPKAPSYKAEGRAYWAGVATLIAGCALVIVGIWVAV